jgi:hypothetical protein
MKTTAIGFALALLAVPAQAQTADDQRWAPWLGCWELVTESVSDAALPQSGVSAGRSQRVPDDTRPRICVTSASPGGATFTTTVAGKTALEQTVIADANERPINDGECRGTQRADWSDDGLRLYARAELTCGRDQTPRRVSGLALFGPDATWLDVQAVEVSGRENVRVRRYRRIATQGPGPVAARVTATRLTLDDVKEASAKVTARAVEAALVETGASFDLTASSLIDLDDAGVPGSVIDLLVALSYPDRFVVERTRDDRVSTIFLNDPWLLGGAFGYPLWFDDFGFYSPLYGSYYSPYYYSPFAYSYHGRYDPRFVGGGFAVIESGGGTGPSPQPSGAGRAVDGRGYTRVRSRETEAASSSRPITTSSSGAGSSSTSSSSGSSSGASSQGYSGGSSSGDTGRTAVPR